MNTDMEIVTFSVTLKGLFLQQDPVLLVFFFHYIYDNIGPAKDIVIRVSFCFLLMAHIVTPKWDFSGGSFILVLMIL
jgi:hypothetical protein